MEVPISPDMHKEYKEQKEQKPTYENIKKYILEKHGVKVHTAYIAEVKRDCDWICVLIIMFQRKRSL